MIAKVGKDRLFGSREPFVPYEDYYAILSLLDNWFLKAKGSHCLECRIQPLADVLIGRIGKFVNEANDRAITSKLLLQYIVRSYVARQCSRALNLYSVVENPDVDISGYAVIAMQRSVCNDLMQSLIGVFDSLKARRPHYLDARYQANSLFYSSGYLVIEMTLDC